jgi:GxxExxY protein
MFATKYEMDTKVRTKRTDLIYPELSYDIVGALFKVFSAVGAGHKEAVYQRTTALALQDAQVSFKEQVYLPLLFKKEIVGKYFLDFLIEDKRGR